MADLDSRQSPLLLDEGSNAAVGIPLFVVPDTQAVRGDSAAGFYMSDFGENDACAAHCAACEMLKMPVIWNAVDGGVLAHGRNDNPVPAGYRSEGDWPENVRVGVPQQDFASILATRSKGIVLRFYGVQDQLLQAGNAGGHSI